MQGDNVATSTSFPTNVQTMCVTCVRGGQRFVGRYREFLLNAGTLFTFASLVLLIVATIRNPGGLVNAGQARTPLYLVAALVGSVYIWWSAIQGIRERAFTADIPVSFATEGPVILGQYPTASFGAGGLVFGGIAVEFVF